jgi:hypothetical protein
MLVFNFIYKVRKTAIYLVNIVINTFRAYGFRIKNLKRDEKYSGDAGFLL